MTDRQRTIPRRSFVRSAVAIGGAGALAACLDREDTEEVERGLSDPDDAPARQHGWDDVLARDEHGNVAAPQHNVLLTLEYVGDGPTDAERDQLEAAFETLERAFTRGNDGLAFTVGYSPAYFDRFDAALPDSVDLPQPEALASFETPDLDDDALLHLASDHGWVPLEAEEALKGNADELNGVDVEGTLEDIFEVTERRTGFVGEGLPADEQEDVQGIPDSEPVPEDSPLFMGFKSSFEKNQASEDRVTISKGPFEGGTTTHLSHLGLNLHQWYEQDSRDQRVSKMFCPFHAEDGRVEGAGHNLGNDSGVDDCADALADDARTEGVVGHTQKSAQAREDDEPLILRRDFDSTDDDEPALHFLSHQRTISDFAATRDAMNGNDLASDSAVGQRTNNGILQYMNVKRRANYLTPPRRHRALPTPNPE